MSTRIPSKPVLSLGVCARCRKAIVYRTVEGPPLCCGFRVTPTKKPEPRLSPCCGGA